MNGMKSLYRLTLNVRGGLLLGVILLFFEAFFGIMIVWLQKYVIDSVFIDKHYGELIKLSFLLLSCFIFFTVLFVLAPYQCSKVEVKLKKYLGENLVKDIFALPMTKIVTSRTATLVNYINHDVPHLSNLIAIQIPRGIKQVFTSIVLIVCIGTLSLKILIFTLFISLVYFFIGRYYSPRVRKASLEVENKRSDLNVCIEEGISSTREVISYNREKWESDRFQKIFNKYYKAVLLEGSVENRFMFILDPLRWSTSLAVLAYGGYEVFQKNISIGMLIVAYQLIAQFMNSLQGSYQFFMTVSNHLAYLDRIAALFYSVKEVEDNPNKYPQNPLSISFHQVTFGYEESRHIIRNLTFDIALGKKTAFVGTSGSGKSTIAQLLIRNYKPTIGAILIDREPIDLIKRKEWEDKVCIVYQEPYFFPETIRTNLTIGKENVQEEELYRACKDAQILDFILSLDNGFDEVLGERGINLSGGQKQRLAIARALIKDPDILILDESTSALDYQTEFYLQQAIDKRRKGKTTIILAHRLSTIKNADKIIVIEDGKLVEEGDHSTLMYLQGRYHQIIK